jgi:hypothetical protein
MKRCGVFALIAAVLLALDACAGAGGDARYRYELASTRAVSGRQGVCAEGDSFWVSGSLSAGRLGYYQKPAPINAPVRAK